VSRGRKRTIVGLTVASALAAFLCWALLPRRAHWSFVAALKGRPTAVRRVPLGAGIWIQFLDRHTEAYSFDASPTVVEPMMSRELRRDHWAVENDTPVAATFTNGTEKATLVSGDAAGHPYGGPRCYVFFERDRSWLGNLIDHLRTIHTRESVWARRGANRDAADHDPLPDFRTPLCHRP